MSLSKELKAWLIVGIALHETVAPVLRSFVEQEVTKLYEHFDNTFNLKTLQWNQVSTHQELKSLTFQNINDNHLVRNKKKYNYNINSTLDLAKLYLTPFSANRISGFDESLDTSAILMLLGSKVSLLTLVSHVSLPHRSLIQRHADDVRENVRNKWGHYDSAEWTESFFSDCFDKLRMLVSNLGLKDGGKTTLDELDEYKTKGLTLCTGECIDQSLFQLVQHGLSALLADFQNIQKQHSATQDSLAEMQDQQSSKKARLEAHDRQLSDHEEILKNLNSAHESLKSRIEEVEQKVNSQESKKTGKWNSSSVKRDDTSSNSSLQDQSEGDDLASEDTSGFADNESLDVSMYPMYKDMNFKVSINPIDSELEGGKPFVLTYQENLPDEVHSAWVLFGKTTCVEVRKLYENCFCGLKIPPGQKPGFASVEVFTEDKAHSLGATRIFYLSKDKRRKLYQQLVHDPNRQSEFFHEWAASRGGAGGSRSSSPSSSSLGLSNLGNSSQPVDVHVLQTLVDTAAECDAFDFLHMIFNTSAGKVVFDAYKEISPLPEDTAKVNGHEKTAQFLREVFQRLSKEEKKAEEQANEVDWAELERAVKMTQEPLNLPNNEKETTLHGDAIFDKFGYLKAPSAEFTVKRWLENQNFTDDKGAAGCIVKEELDGETLSVGLPEDGCAMECNDPSKEREVLSETAGEKIGTLCCRGLKPPAVRGHAAAFRYWFNAFGHSGPYRQSIVEADGQQKLVATGNPMNAPAVQQTIKQLCKRAVRPTTKDIRHGRVPYEPKKAPPFTLQQLMRIRQYCMKTVEGMRRFWMWTITLFSFALFLRGEEPLRLKIRHLKLPSNYSADSGKLPQRIDVKIPWSKADRKAKGVTLALWANPLNRELCPVTAPFLWLLISGMKKGHNYIFPRVTKNNRTVIPNSARGVTSYRKLFLEMSKTLFETEFTTHSIRRSAARWAARCGANDTSIKRAGRWKSNSYELYTQDARAEMIKEHHDGHPVLDHKMWMFK